MGQQSNDSLQDVYDVATIFRPQVCVLPSRVPRLILGPSKPLILFSRLLLPACLHARPMLR